MNPKTVEETGLARVRAAIRKQLIASGLMRPGAPAPKAAVKTSRAQFAGKLVRAVYPLSMRG